MVVTPVVVTRARDDATATLAALHAQGALVVHAPLIATVDLDVAPLQRALRASPGSWVACTSRRAVAAAHRAGIGAGPYRLACVGHGTVRAAQSLGLHVDLVPSQADALHLAMALVDAGASTVVFPCARDAHDHLPRGLGDAGAQVMRVPCYATINDAQGVLELRELLDRETRAVVTFASGSAVRSFAGGIPRALWPRARCVTIGRTTAAEADAAGLQVVAVADEASPEGVARAATRVARAPIVTH
jgi:uroporphyrinogen-III synthase